MFQRNIVFPCSGNKCEHGADVRERRAGVWVQVERIYYHSRLTFSKIGPERFSETSLNISRLHGIESQRTTKALYSQCCKTIIHSCFYTDFVVYITLSSVTIIVCVKHLLVDVIIR
jgi:hypothetical protein